jgi:hypothetical protein
MVHCSGRGAKSVVYRGHVASSIGWHPTRKPRANERPSDACLTLFILFYFNSSASHALCSHLPSVSAMASSQQQTAHEGVFSTLDVLIQALNFAKDSCGIPPAQIAFGSASVLLAMIRVCSLLLLFRSTSDSRLSRTRCPTTRIMSNLARLAVIYVRYSTGN